MSGKMSERDIMDISKLREAGNPHWVDVLPAGEFLGLADKTVLHSGPPIEFGRMCAGHRRSMVNACLFEGWAKSESEATALLEKGEVKCEAAYDYATDGSGYGIITKSVPLLIVEDRDYGSRAGLFPAEGRFGGGFCGWGESTTTLDNCLFAPAEGSSISGGGNFCNNVVGTVSNSYYTMQVGSSTQGTAVGAGSDVVR